jgi:hypothetical protein
MKFFEKIIRSLSDDVLASSYYYFMNEIGVGWGGYAEVASSIKVAILKRIQSG